MKLSSMKLFVLTAVIFSFQPSFGKSLKIEKYYFNYVTADATIYFIKPQVGFVADDLRLEFDQTILSNNDTVTFTMSVYSSKVIQIDSISVISNEGVASSLYNSFYIEPNKKKWKMRGAAKLDKHIHKLIFGSSSVPVIRLFAKNNTSFDFTMKPKRWAEVSEINKMIFFISEMNQ